MSDGGKNKGTANLPDLPSSGDPDEIIAQPTNGQARDIAAEKVGLKPRTAEKLETVINAADAGDAVARAGLDRINDSRRGVENAYRKVVHTSKGPIKAESLINGAQGHLDKIAKQLKSFGAALRMLHDTPLPDSFFLSLKDLETQFKNICSKARKQKCVLQKALQEPPTPESEKLETVF